jgi:hypothetical protein
MSAEAHAIPDWAVRAAQTAYETPVREDASLVSLVSRDVSDDVLNCLAKAINDAVMAERERCAEICVARSKEHAASRHQWKDSDSVNLCLSDSIEALNCASAIRAAPKAEGK